MSQMSLGHHLTGMNGRDPNETHRSATSLELLYDLTFVVAFGLAADQLAHMLADGHLWEGIGGFSFAMFAVCWAWTNFSWFASAFDTNDWLYRITTMVQMAGVVVLALGLPPMFHSLVSLEEGGHLDFRIMVAGYVVMRVAMVAQWLRAIAQAPRHRSAALAHPSLSLSRTWDGLPWQQPTRRRRRYWQCFPSLFCWNLAGRSWLKREPAVRPGTPTISLSATDCSPSSRWEREYSVRWCQSPP